MTILPNQGPRMFNRFLLLVACCAAMSLQAQVTVVNGASFRTDQPVAPGSLASAFGAFGLAASAEATGLPLPTTLSGFTVRIDDSVNAPLLFISSGQVNFQVPSSLTPGRHTIRVTAGNTTQDGSFLVTDGAPGVFEKESAPAPRPRRAAVLNQNFSENTEANPAPRGQVVQIFATGFGALSTPVTDGTAAPATPATTREVPEVFIGGLRAQVQFSGLAPGFVGLWQINVVVPANSVTGRVPMRVVVQGGVESNEVVLFVAQ